MGFMDKVVELGNQAADQMNQVVSKSQQSLSEAQQRRDADALLRDLGALVHRRDTGRADAATELDIERISARLREHEEAGSVIDLALRAESPLPPPPPSAGTEA